MSDVLERILARKRQEVTARKAAVSEAELRDRIAQAGPVRDFAGALTRAAEQRGAGVIAEIKKASPSQGVIRADFKPAEIAARYETGGAACLSVLTDIDFFQGSDAYLQAARDACGLPVLRKDFMVDAWQILESRALGADCILLIVAGLSDSQLRDYTALAHDLGMAVLCEVHTQGELARVVDLPVDLMGVNNRDLRTFKTDVATTLKLRERAPVGVPLVSESGLSQPEPLARLLNAGVQRFLIGEAFMRQPDPGSALRQLVSAAVAESRPQTATD